MKLYSIHRYCKYAFNLAIHKHYYIKLACTKIDQREFCFVKMTESFHCLEFEPKIEPNIVYRCLLKIRMTPSTPLNLRSYIGNMMGFGTGPGNQI